MSPMHFTSNLGLLHNHGYLDDSDGIWHAGQTSESKSDDAGDNKPWDGPYWHLPWIGLFHKAISRASWDTHHYHCPRIKDPDIKETAQVCAPGGWTRNGDSVGYQPGDEVRHPSVTLKEGWTNHWITGGKLWPAKDGKMGKNNPGGLIHVGRFQLKRRHLLLLHISGYGGTNGSLAEEANQSGDDHANGRGTWNIRNWDATVDEMYVRTLKAEQYLVAGTDVVLHGMIRGCGKNGTMMNWGHGMQALAILGPNILCLDNLCNYKRAVRLYDNYDIDVDRPNVDWDDNDVHGDNGFFRCAHWNRKQGETLDTDYDYGILFGYRSSTELLPMVIPNHGESDYVVRDVYREEHKDHYSEVGECRTGQPACPAGSTELESKYPKAFPVVWEHVSATKTNPDAQNSYFTGDQDVNKDESEIKAHIVSFEEDVLSAITELELKGLALPGEEYIAILGFLNTRGMMAPHKGETDCVYPNDGCNRMRSESMEKHGRSGPRSRASYHVYRRRIVGLDDADLEERYHNMEALWTFANGVSSPQRKASIQQYVACWAARNKYTANEAYIADGLFKNYDKDTILSMGDPAQFQEALTADYADCTNEWHRHYRSDHTSVADMWKNKGMETVWAQTVARNQEFVSDLMTRDKAFQDLVFAAWSMLNPEQKEISQVTNTAVFLKAFCGRAGGETKRTWTELEGATSKYKFEGEGLRQNDPRCFCLGYPFFHEPYMMPVRHDVLCARLRYDSNRTGPLAYHYRQGILDHNVDGVKVLDVSGNNTLWWRAGEMPGDVLDKLETGTDGLAKRYKRSVVFRTLAHGSRGTSYSHDVPDDAQIATRLSLMAWLKGDKNEHYNVSGLGSADVAYGVIDALWLHNKAEDATAAEEELYLNVKPPSEIGRGQSRRKKKTTYFAFGGGVLSRNTLKYGPDFPSVQYGEKQRVYPEYTEKYNHPREYKSQGTWETWPSLPQVSDAADNGPYYNMAGKRSFVFKITKDKTYAEEEERARKTVDSTKWIGGIAVHCPDDVTLRVWTSWRSELPAKTATAGWTEMAHMVKTPDWDEYVGDKDMLPDPKLGYWGVTQDSTRKTPLPKLIYEREGTLRNHSMKNVVDAVVKRRADSTSTDRDLYLSTTGKDGKTTKYFKVGRYNNGSGWSTLGIATLGTAGKVPSGNVHYPMSPAQLRAFTATTGQSSSGSTFSSGASEEDQLMQNADVDKTQQVTSTFMNASGDLQQEPVIAPHTLLFEYKKDDKTKIFPFHQDVDATWVRIDVVGTVPQKLQVMCMAVRTHKPLHVGNYQVVGRDEELLNGFYDLKIGEDKRFDDRSRGWRDGVYVDLAAAGRWDWDADDYYGSGFTALIQQDRQAVTHSPFCWDTRCKVGRTDAAKDNDINLNNGQYWVEDKCQERLLCMNFIAEQNIINSIDTQVNMINNCAPGGYESLTCKQLKDMEEDMCAGSDWLTNLSSISLSQDDALSTAVRRTKCCAATAAQGTCDRNVTVEQCAGAGQAYLAELIDNAATVPGTTVQVCCKHNPAVVGAPSAAPPATPTTARCADFDKNQCIPASAYTGELNLSATGSTAVACCAKKLRTDAAATCDAFAGCVADDDYTGERVAVPWSIEGATKAVCCEKKKKMCDAFDKDECTYGHHTGDLIEDAATTEGETARECCAKEDLFTPIMEDLGLGDAWDEVMQLSFAVRLCILAALVFVGVGAYQRHVQRNRAYGMGGPPGWGGPPRAMPY